MKLIHLATIVALAALVAIATTATAQEQLPDGFKRCGDESLVLVFMNPDLRAADDGFIHAGGSFFIQFQARGEKAFDIETLKFSFGPYVAGTPEACNDAESVTGAYIKNYRSDYDPGDGFHIPINTCLVPDGTYAAAISAYDSSQKELVRYYTTAVVENGGRTNPREPCDKAETTAPWPIILPGDGERKDGGQGLYIEVGEPVANIEAFINGRKLILTEGLGPARDDDVVPDLGYTPELRGSDAAQGQLGKRQYPAFTWDGVLTPGDVIRVRVTDLWGNSADKVVHLGDPTIGGRVTGAKPLFDLDIPVKDQDANINGTATYNVTYITRNEEGLHADLYVSGPKGEPLPAGITYRLTPDHVMMGGNAELKGTITLIARPDTPLGTYQIVFTADYLTGSGREQKATPLTFRVVEQAAKDSTKDDEVADTNQPIEQQDVRGDKVTSAAVEEAPPEEQRSKLPMPSPLLVIAGLGLVALARRRLK